MGDLRLYAIGVEEVRSFPGAPQHLAEQLSEIARRALTPDPAPGGLGVPGAAGPRHGLLSRLGPLFKRDPQAVVIDPNQPTPQDVTNLIGGHFVPDERNIATWRLLEILIQGWSWGSTRLSLDPRALDDLDFALARGGVSAAVGVRHLLANNLRLPLSPAAGLTVGFQPYVSAVDMGDAYRQALPQVPGTDQQQLIAGLVKWLDGFPHWAAVAPTLGRPIPDLVGFWVS